MGQVNKGRLLAWAIKELPEVIVMLQRHLLALIAILLTVVSQPSHAIEMAFRCSNVLGTNITAPSWEPGRDGFRGQSVLLHFTDTGVGTVIGFDGLKYQGIAMRMNGGFAIIVAGDEFVETFVVNASNQELMMTAIRTGSSALPNSAKAYRGTCKPAGNEISR